MTSTTTPLRLIRNGYPDEPALDTAVARALLLQASDGEIPETLRLHVPGRVMAFGKRDTLEPSYPDAVRACVSSGFTPIERLAGGRAAVFTEHTLAFTWTVPSPDPRSGIYPRFERLSSAMVATFRRLGVPTAVGQIPGEYCPGDYSVHHAGRIKLMGVGQRLARNAAHVGGVVMVGGTRLAREALVAVYDALGLTWDPSTVGALTDVRLDITVEDVAHTLVEELAGPDGWVPATPLPSTIARARRLAGEHDPRARLRI